MSLFVLVFISDALVSLFAAKVNLALVRLSYRALIWDVLLTLTIGVNVLGFVQAGYLMLIPSVLGSLLGTFGAIWHGRRYSPMHRRTPVRVEGFRAGSGSDRGNQLVSRDGGKEGIFGLDSGMWCQSDMVEELSDG